MMTANLLKNGTWVVNWTLQDAPGPGPRCSGHTNFNLVGHKSTYQLAFHLKSSSSLLGLTLKIVGFGFGDEDRPRVVTAYFNGQMREMSESSRGYWSRVDWNYPIDQFQYCNPWGQNHVCCVNFLLLFDFDSPATVGERSVLNHLSQLFDTKTMADVQFVVQGHKIGAHVAIIVSGSPVLAAMFEHDRFVESQTKLVQVEDTEPRVFQQMLHYLYTGTAPELERESMTEQLFLAADKYQIESLKQICEEKLQDNLTLDNVVNRLVMAHLHSAPKLLETALASIVGRKRDVWARPEWKELMKNYPDLFFLASHRMIG